MSNPFFSILLFLLPLKGFSQSIEGVYVGLQELCFTDSSGNKDCEWDKSFLGYKWFHLTEIKLTNDSVYMDMSPIAIKGTDTMYSASIGGFYYRRGSYTQKDSIVKIATTHYSCDYCPVLINDSAEPIITIERIEAKCSSNGLRINGSFYEKSSKIVKLYSESNLYYKFELNSKEED